MDGMDFWNSLTYLAHTYEPQDGPGDPRGLPNVYTMLISNSWRISVKANASV